MSVYQFLQENPIGTPPILRRIVDACAAFGGCNPDGENRLNLLFRILERLCDQLPLPDQEWGFDSNPATLYGKVSSANWKPLAAPFKPSYPALPGAFECFITDIICGWRRFWIPLNDLFQLNLENAAGRRGKLGSVLGGKGTLCLISRPVWTAVRIRAYPANT
jgi:hypothetical protein